ncbi:hypothetical protein ABIA39_006430 [Nocardia sp. GAS34]|uniref:lipase family protein n=1 Tax=unclassified Nocardia TaxID=2637762 RepID=UPI003D1B8BB0
MLPHAPADKNGLPPDLATLWHAIQSSPTGDPLFDNSPADLARYRPGDIIESRDVTWPAVPMVLTSVMSLFQRAVLLKFRTTDANGTPSFGTATLLVPFNPWTGPGARPVVLNATPINALNRRCTPGYVLSHGYSLDAVNGNDFVPSPTMWAVSQNYAVVIPDHEGALMSYAEPTVAGHTMLDTVRAVRHVMPDQFGASRFAMTGYSGGAIATHAAAMLIDEYAPELKPQLAGAVMGGLATDYKSFARTYDGTYVSGLLMTIALAMAREHPEMLGRMNHLAQWAAMSPYKEVCSSQMATLGVFGIPFEALANNANPLYTEFAEKMFQRLSLKDRKAGMPLYIYNGKHDIWMSATGAEELYDKQCALGVQAVKNIVGGEHILAYFGGYLAAMDWMGHRLRNEPVPGECNPARSGSTPPATGGGRVH